MSFNPALLNQNSIKKFVDRLEKVYSKRLGDKAVKRTQVYEDVAHLFGYDSWHNLDQAMKSLTPPPPSSEILNFLNTPGVDLLNADSRKSFVKMVSGQQPDGILQSVRELLYFLNGNPNHEKIKIAVVKEFYNSGIASIKEKTNEIADILSGSEFLRFRKDEPKVKVDDPTKTQIAPTPLYLAGAHILAQREKFVVRDFASQACNAQFSAPTQNTPQTRGECEQVLAVLAQEFKRLSPLVSKLNEANALTFLKEINTYLYKENGLFFKYLNMYHDREFRDQCMSLVKQHFADTRGMKM